MTNTTFLRVALVALVAGGLGSAAAQSHRPSPAQHETAGGEGVLRLLPAD